MLPLNELWRKDKRFKSEVKAKLKENKQMTEDYAKKVVYDEWVKAEIDFENQKLNAEIERQKMLAYEAEIQNLMNTRHITRIQAEEMYKAIQEHGKEKLAKEQIKNLRSVSSQFDESSRDMERQANRIREEALKAYKQGFDKECESSLRTVAKMRSFGKTFKGISMRVNNCAVQLEAIQNIGKIPSLMQSINGVLEICGNFDTLQFEFQNFAQVMNNIDKMLFDIEKQLSFDPFDADSSYEASDNFNAILEEEKRNMIRIAADMDSEDPRDNVSGDNYKNFADSDSIITMISDETK